MDHGHDGERNRNARPKAAAVNLRPVFPVHAARLALFALVLEGALIMAMTRIGDLAREEGTGPWSSGPTPTVVVADGTPGREVDPPLRGEPASARRQGVTASVREYTLVGETTGGAIGRGVLPDGSMCVVVERGSEGFRSCTSADAYNRGELTLTYAADEHGPIEVYALLPDGYSLSGPGIDAESQNGAWYATFPNGAMAVEVLGPGGVARSLHPLRA